MVYNEDQQTGILTMRVSGLVSIGSLLFVKSAWACSVCFGNAGSKMSEGIFAALYFLLGLILLVLGGIVLTAFHWANRAKNLEAQSLVRW